MFTGIVEAVVPVAALDVAAGSAAGGRRLRVELGALWPDLRPGASVAVNGVCLTLAARSGPLADFDVIPETLRRTNLGALAAGEGVNVERSLRAGDAIDGHFVQGHVDAVGEIVRIDASGERRVWVHAPPTVRPCLVPKGSVALDGVSLTIAELEAERFAVALIPTTLERTTLGRRRVGERVNIETDVLARLVVQRLDAVLAARRASEPRLVP